MREDYKLQGDTGKMEITVEKDVAEKIQKMAEYTKLSASEIANTALKRFISTHKDFLPPRAKK
ncbi:MAG TPA: hypothetical protein VL588_04270 [Bdellovibrionota bacterium]|jgi:hypothetical protein|nr:hypothetical protein [Bdellovibrionota bacterium]